MSHTSLDAFQLLVAVYLFYVAVRGSGTLYNFPEVPKQKQESVRQVLRKIYFAGGCIALLDGAASMLQNSMFTAEYTENGVNITQNYTLDALPFITYRMLTTVSIVCTVAFVLLLAGVIIYTRKTH